MASQMLWSPKKSHREDLMAQKGILGTPGMSKEQKQQAMGRARLLLDNKLGRSNEKLLELGLLLEASPGSSPKPKKLLQSRRPKRLRRKLLRLKLNPLVLLRSAMLKPGLLSNVSTTVASA